MFTGELDHDVLQHDASATDAMRVPRPAWADVPFSRRARHVPLSGGAFFADVTAVAS